MQTHYSRLQIALHWIMFILIAFQIIVEDPIGDAWHAVRKGNDPDMTLLVWAHIVIGFAVLALVLWRLVLRLTRGVPPVPEKEPPMMKLAAHVAHWALYGLMILLPVSGAMAWFGGVGSAAEVHEVLKGLLIALVALHVVAAFYHQFVLKTNLLDRMRTPG